MLNMIAKRLTAYIIHANPSENERMLCEYGCEIWLYTVISTLGLFLIGLIVGMPMETVVMIAFFYLMQSNGGGYHASTHLRCFLTMASGLIAGLASLSIPIVCAALPVCSVAAIILLLAFPLHLHKNKQYLEVKKDKLKRRSRLITLSLGIGLIVLMKLSDSSIYEAGCAAVVLSAVSRLYAIGADRKQHFKDNENVTPPKRNK